MKENKEVANMNIKELRTYAKEQYELSGNGKPWMSNKMDKAYNEFSKAKRLIKAFEATHSVEAEVEIYKTLRA